MKYKNIDKQYAYENALDCLYFGYGKKYWMNSGLNEEEANEVWEEAKNDLANMDFN